MSIFKRLDSGPKLPSQPKPPEPKAELSVYDALFKALEKHGVMPKNYGKSWARIPAIWRGSRDFNVSVNLVNGTATDFPDGERRIEFQELMALLEYDPGNVKIGKNDNFVIANDNRRKMLYALNMMKRGMAISTDNAAATVAVKYLRSRGLPDETIALISHQVRAVPGDFGGVIMMSPIYSPRMNGSIISIQRTFLSMDGNQEPERPRAMLGSRFDGDKAGGFLIRGDKSRFNDTWVAVVEGLETGLAVSAATGMPVYVTYNANGISALCVEYLSSLGVTGILIAADNDDPDKYGRRAGQEAANELAERVTADNSCPVKIALPPRKLTNGKKCDWLDIWNIDPIGCGRLLLSAPEFKSSTESIPSLRPGMKNMFVKGSHP